MHDGKEFLIILFLVLSCVSKAQISKGFSIYAEAPNWANLLQWNEEDLEWWEQGERLMNPPQTFKLGVDWIKPLGKPQQAHFFSLGISAIFQSTTYNKTELMSWFPDLYPHYITLSNQLFLGIDIGYTKEFLFNKQKRSRFRPFIAVQLGPYYGIYQQHKYSSPKTDEKVRTELIEADNYFMVVGQLNLGANIYIDKKKRKAIGVYMPIAYTQTFSESFNSFASFGFVGVKYAWFK
jgi:hypothetical protein